MLDVPVSKYELAEALHALPHLNLSLQDTSRVFNFSSEQYIQVCTKYQATFTTHRYLL